MTYLYDDPGHPDRMTGSFESQEWTEADRCLALALSLYESTLCPGCDQPRERAWHSEMSGWYETEGVVCYACSALEGKTTGRVRLRDTYTGTLPPFKWGETTESLNSSPASETREPRGEGGI